MLGVLGICGLGLGVLELGPEDFGVGAGRALQGVGLGVWEFNCSVLMI